MTHTSVAAPLGTCDVALGKRGGRGGPPLYRFMKRLRLTENQLSSAT